MGYEIHVDEIVELNGAVCGSGSHAMVADDDYIDDLSKVSFIQALKYVVQHCVHSCDCIPDFSAIRSILVTVGVDVGYIDLYQLRP